MAIIDKPSDYFNTKLYTGNGGSNSITGVGFQPDLTWIKCRNLAQIHNLYDSIRGITKALYTSASFGEDTYTMMSSFDSDGWSMNGNLDLLNGSGNTYASWNWKAGGTAVSNTDGSITSSVSANQDAGFSIVSYTGTGSNSTVGHGLNSAPSFVIIKDRGNALSWVVSGDNIGWNKNMYLDSTQAVQTANHFQDTAPTSSLMYLSTDAAVNGSSRNYIMYCFAEKQGYSKFGSYVAGSDTTAKPNNDGTFIYTGFKPRFIMTKRTDGTSNWCIFDTVRSTLNPMYNILFPNISDAENTSEPIDVYSNGWKPRADSGFFNYPVGSNWIYYAIAENPFVTSTGVPTTAR